MKHRGRNPDGWDTNPSCWPKRAVLFLCAGTGFLIAAYLSLHQLGWMPHTWDPFFGNGTDMVLDSQFSKAFPIPDALLGALGYGADCLLVVLGGRRRWQTAPWIVVAYGLTTAAMGATGVTLAIVQPVVVGSWCSWCLLSALISVCLVGPALEEMLAALQYLRRARRERHRLWKTFWGLEPVR